MSKFTVQLQQVSLTEMHVQSCQAWQSLVLAEISLAEMSDQMWYVCMMSPDNCITQSQPWGNVLQVYALSGCNRYRTCQSYRPVTICHGAQPVAMGVVIATETAGPQSSMQASTIAMHAIWTSCPCNFNKVKALVLHACHTATNKCQVNTYDKCNQVQLLPCTTGTWYLVYHSWPTVAHSSAQHTMCCDSVIQQTLPKL